MCETGHRSKDVQRDRTTARISYCRGVNLDLVERQLVEGRERGCGNPEVVEAETEAVSTKALQRPQVRRVRMCQVLFDDFKREVLTLDAGSVEYFGVTSAE